MLALAAQGAHAREATDEWVVMNPAEGNGGTDTYLDSMNPFTTQGESGDLRVSADPMALALLRFDFVDAFPVNATLLSAHLTLTQTQASREITAPHRLEVRRINVPFDELAATWDNWMRPGAVDGAPLATAEMTTTPGARYNLTLTSVVSTLRSQLVNGTSDFFGWALVASRDAIPVGDENLDTTFTLASSNRVEAEADRRPQLALHFERNGPRLQNLTVNSDANGTFAIGVNATFQVEAFDPRGDVASVKVQVRNDTGLLRHEFPLAPTERYNNTLVDDGARNLNEPLPYRYWSGNFSIPQVEERPYRIDVEAVDNDGVVMNVTIQKGWFVRVDNVTPDLFDANATPRVFDERGRVNVSANVTDNEGVREVAAIARHPVLGAREFPMRPHGGIPLRNDTYSTEFALAEPGAWTVQVMVRDRSNLVNLSEPINLTVRDVTRPDLVDAVVENARGDVFDEAGANVTFSIRARDVSPLTVTLNLTDPLGQWAHHVLPLVGNETYTITFVLEVPGEWRAAFQAVDAEGNARVIDGGSFSVLQGEAPAFRWASDAPPGAWLNASPVLALLVLDPNLDASSVTPTLLVDGAPLETVPFTTEPLTEGLLLRLAPVLATGERLSVAVEAADVYGNEATARYAFLLDRAPPTTLLTSVAPAIEREENRFLVANATRVTLAGSDVGSGLASTWWRLASEPADAARRYTGPFALPPTAGDANLLYWSEDAAGNRESPPQVARLTFATAPPVANATVEAGALVGTVTPGTPGVALTNVTVLIRVDEGAWRALPAAKELDTGTGAIRFRAALPAAGAGLRVQYAVHATDALGNLNFPLDAPVALGDYSEGNNPPMARFLAPEAGSRGSGLIRIQWEATDLDAETLQVSLKARGTRLGETFTLRDPAEPFGTHEWDTRKLPNGPYELVLTVKDAAGEPVTLTRLVHVDAPGNDLIPASDLKLASDTQGRVPVRVRINQDATEVVLVLSGPETIRVPLHDDGAHDDGRAGDGVYGAILQFPNAGDYVGSYEMTTRDGRTLTSAASLSVSVADAGMLTPGVAVLGVLAAAGVAVLARRR